jgi:vacuolar-type H+-ATPase subunit E/Vma4
VNASIAAGAGPVRDSLQPVCDALLRRARADAAACRADAARSCTRLLADARAEADRILDEAHSSGRADAALLDTAEAARTRRTAHAFLLEAQREVYDELGRRVAQALQAELAAGRLGPALAARAAAALGPGAQVEPAPGGGFTARLDGRCADCSVEALVRHAMAAAGRAGEVWT